MLVFAAVLAFTQHQPPQDLPPGTLISDTKTPIILPLKGTSVNADVSGFTARVTVEQTFTNPSSSPIEAVYTFPLPPDSAVDHMTMKIGDRVIKGIIKRREEAQAIYQAAKNAGQSAALLDQERPNIFTQSVANITPGAQVKIEISYVQVLKYEAGQFEFNFPMVVGPRFLGNAPDPGKISPPVMPKGTRTGTNIDLKVNLNAGAPIVSVKSILHEIKVDERGVGQDVITLKRKDEIPNKDFILHYQMATNSVQSALLGKYDPVKGGHFSLILLPPAAPTRQQIAPKEVIFVIDQSGSQNGFPIEKSKELTKKLIARLNPGDTFNVLGFSNSVNYLWPAPQQRTGTNLEQATAFVDNLQANGGTQLKIAVDGALAQPDDPQRVKLVVFNTDGFIGDEKEVLKTIREHRGSTRMFTFGIGNSVNRYLIDAMSEEGRGDSEVVTLAENANGAADRFIQRTNNPILTDVSVKIDGVEVTDQLPDAIPDVFSEKPIVVYGKYATPGRAKITITGNMAGKPWSQTIDAVFPSDKPGNESIPTIWARRMVEKLDRAYNLSLNGDQMPVETKNQLVDLALEYGIMSQYTSFVAVEQRVVNIGGKQRKVAVPVDRADGVNMDISNGLVRRGATKSSGMISPTVMGLLSGGRSSNRGAAAGAPASTSYISYDPADNSFVVSEKEIQKLPLEEQKKIREQRATVLFDTKVAKSLRDKSGSLEAMVWLTAFDEKILLKLENLGLKVAKKDKGLMLVIGTVDSASLRKLAELTEVKRIEPLQ